MFERGKIDFSKRTFVHDGIYAHTKVLLIVCAEMLDADAYAVLLYAVYVRGSHSSRKERILRKVLEVSSAERTSFDVYAGSQNRGNAERMRFFRKCGTDFFYEVFIPARSKSYRGREASSRFRRAHNVCRRALFFFTYSVGSVTQPYGGNAEPVYCFGEPESISGTKGRFFFERHLTEYIAIFVFRHKLTSTRDMIIIPTFAEQ